MVPHRLPYSLSQSSTVADTGPCSHSPSHFHILPHRIPHVFHLLSILLPLTVSHSSLLLPTFYGLSAHTSASHCMPDPLACLAPCQFSGLLPEAVSLYKKFLSIQIKDFTLGSPLKTLPAPPHCVECIPTCNYIFMFLFIVPPPNSGAIWVVLPKTQLLAPIPSSEVHCASSLSE